MPQTEQVGYRTFSLKISIYSNFLFSDKRMMMMTKLQKCWLLAVSMQVFKTGFALCAPRDFGRQTLYHPDLSFLLCWLDLFCSKNEDYPLALFQTSNDRWRPQYFTRWPGVWRFHSLRSFPLHWAEIHVSLLLLVPQRANVLSLSQGRHRHAGRQISPFRRGSSVTPGVPQLSRCAGPSCSWFPFTDTLQFVNFPL